MKWRRYARLPRQRRRVAVRTHGAVNIGWRDNLHRCGLPRVCPLDGGGGALGVRQPCAVLQHELERPLAHPVGREAAVRAAAPALDGDVWRERRVDFS